MNDMLGATQDYARLMKDFHEKVSGKEGLEWLEEFKLFLKRQPSWAQGMICTPLEWTVDLGHVDESSIQAHININKREGDADWRLPTDKELSRALRTMKPEGFSLHMYYWSSTPHYDGRGMTVIHTYDGRGGVGQGSHFVLSNECVLTVQSSHTQVESAIRKRPRLRLCRPLKIPGH